MSARFSMDGRGAVVTGAGSGLGRAMAEAMAEAGARVTLADIDGDRAAAVAGALRDQGSDVRTAVVDVADASAVTAVIEEATASYGRLDAVFANAGISAGRSYSDPTGRLDVFSRDAWERVLAVNLTGVLNTMSAAATVMRRAGRGKIVVTASTAGLRADPMVGYPYIAAKAAVVNLVKQAALELAPHGVTVNAIAPGPFKTNIGGSRGADPAVEKAWAETVPLSRMGDPEEIKGLALLLGSDASSFMTGAVYPVDGGALALSHQT